MIAFETEDEVLVRCPKLELVPDTETRPARPPMVHVAPCFGNMETAHKVDGDGCPCCPHIDRGRYLIHNHFPDDPWNHIGVYPEKGAEHLANDI